MNFKIGAFYVCTCKFETCCSYFKVIGYDPRDKMLEVLTCEGKEDYFHLGEAKELLVSAKVFHSPLYQAFK